MDRLELSPEDLDRLRNVGVDMGIIEMLMTDDGAEVIDEVIESLVDHE